MDFSILIQLTYLVAISFFIVGVKRLGSPATARKGNQYAALGMLIGVAVTLLDRNILTFDLIIAGIMVGSLVGGVAARKVEMTSMPELVALFNGFGGAASALVAWGELSRVSAVGLDIFSLVTISLSVLIGAVTFTGSFIAFGKLQGFITGKPITFPGQNLFNIALIIGLLGLSGYFAVVPEDPTLFWIVMGVSLLLGILMVIPIGGADMPVVISLLNSLSGIAASFAGFVLGNQLLIVSGALVGAAGLILTNIMCKAMNRTLTNVIFGAFGGDQGGAAAGSGAIGDLTIRETSAEDAAVQCAYASKVVIVPGY